MALTAPATTGTDGTAAATGKKRTARRNARIRGADDMAVASFVLGLPGLLVANVLFGPTAILLAAMALWHGTARHGRAWSGMALGFADLVVLAVLVTADGTVSWSF
jgi:hypothetical protein